MSDFETTFRNLTDNSPFPWQVELHKRFVQGGDAIPSRCDIPTGLGKTSVIACWLLARQQNKSLPRRLVYVVNRRTVVDQTTEEVKKYLKVMPSLRVSTLRGQFADNREWSADPSMPAVICGTVDMIGSRLLFSGYGIGFKGRPLHAGFLGQDSLIVHDEAHLEPAFQDLLIAIQQEQQLGRFPDRTPLRVMELSATSRRDDGSPPLKLEAADHAHPVVRQRVQAHKLLTLHPIADERKMLADRLAELALSHDNAGRAVLVFVRSVDDLGKVVAKLPKGRVRQLTGTMRGFERDKLVGDALFKRFLPKPDEGKDTVYLVCTSAGEVGVNISADHLVCDLSTFESMAQRFGRVNRFGEPDDTPEDKRRNTRIDVVHPASFDDPKKLVFSDRRVVESTQRTLALLSPLGGHSVSPFALSQLDAKARIEAFAPTPEIPPVSDILFDAWSMTSVTGKLPGRPEVGPYLHGIAEWEPPQTKVGWRTEVGEIVGDLLSEHPPEELLDIYPLKPHELLSDRADRVFNTLKKLSKPELPAWLIDEDGTVVPTTVSNILARGKEAIENLTLLLPPAAGGLENGFITGVAADDDSIRYDVADEWSDESGSFRQRVWSTPDDADPRPPKGMKLVRKIAFHATDADDADAEPAQTWHWFVRLSAADVDARSRKKSYDLQPHLDDARSVAEGFVSRLALDVELARIAVLASTYHDLGKDREGWQRGIGNANYDQGVRWAKSGKPLNRAERSSYRHEFGSTLDVRSTPEFESLSPEGQDLLLHVIAAHHGRARPHFAADESLDDKHLPEHVQELAIEAPRRFARLQRKYGRWGLAYLESLVRAADYAASRKAEEGDA